MVKFKFLLILLVKLIGVNKGRRVTLKYFSSYADVFRIDLVPIKCHISMVQIVSIHRQSE